MARTKFKILGDGTYFGEVPGFRGVWANANTLEECRKELQEVLERVDFAQGEIEGTDLCPEIKIMRRLTGEILNDIYRLGARQARYREDGKWYHPLTKFPALFFDAYGYIEFKTKDAYQKCSYLQLGQDGNVIDNGISAIPGYVSLNPPPCKYKP
jgi:hypothetical protein